MKKVVGAIIIICVIIGIVGCGSEKSSKSEKSDYGNTTATTSGYGQVSKPKSSAAVNPKTNDSSTTKVKCNICNGKGICKDCDGSGKTSRKKDSINLGGGSSSYNVYSKCALCDGDGKCYKCSGKGYLSY